MALAPINALTLYTPTSTVTTITLTPTQAATANPPVWTGHAAYDPTVLIPPAPPSPPVTRVDVPIPADPVGAGFQLSIPQHGNFLGFSIELSVATAVMGKNAGKLEPAFLNYMVNLKNRARAGPIIRVGGNTQDSSSLSLTSFANGVAVEKIKQGPKITSTPIVSYSLDLLHLMANITSLVGIDWFFGLPFNSTTIPTHEAALVAKTALSVLGPKLRALSLGNEPDLYAGHQERDPSYNLQAYLGEFTQVRTDVLSAISEQSLLAGPSVCCSVEGFDIGDVLSAGWLTTNAPYLSYVTIQRYPYNNCGVNGKVVDPQAIFSSYLSHTGPQALTSLYLEASNAAQAVGKPIIMQEMNTASCGGSPASVTALAPRSGWPTGRSSLRGQTFPQPSCTSVVKTSTIIPSLPRHPRRTATAGPPDRCTTLPSSLLRPLAPPTPPRSLTCSDPPTPALLTPPTSSTRVASLSVPCCSTTFQTPPARQIIPPPSASTAAQSPTTSTCAISGRSTLLSTTISPGRDRRSAPTSKATAVCTETSTRRRWHAATACATSSYRPPPSPLCSSPRRRSTSRRQCRMP
ncbi:hypothetical protein VHUM_02156 [Vanrija humicola]|uniref:Beta-glucuronidase C-terminal domain-containing protein n=1 Tax=Vanrija humicola TaxID=5417 RepID=A0A7D8UZD2_VANHU|nr:hypothetical protein VHUM_02156 [Vanrija humicola]